jgi:hypothetical protein
MQQISHLTRPDKNDLIKYSHMKNILRFKNNNKKKDKKEDFLVDGQWVDCNFT